MAEAWGLLWRIAWGLGRRRPLPRLRRSLAAPRPARLAGVSEAAAPEEVARLVRAAATLFPLETTCLHRSLCLEALLRRRGVEAELQLGVRTAEGDLAAHAWVEHAGSAIAEPAASRERFRRLRPVPPPTTPR